MEDEMKTTETASSLPQDQDTLKEKETFRLISANKVEGTNIYNLRGDDVGEVDDLMIDKHTGKVAYAVVTYGGFLGMGAERRALPWSVLDYDTNRGGYVVSAADDILKSAPAGITERELNDRAWGTRVYDHFGVPPYWM
jgi:sporulation protein YlmC with PRC-barrel domain